MYNGGNDGDDGYLCERWDMTHDTSLESKENVLR